MSSARRLVTERLVIATATQQHLLVELDDAQKLGPLLGASIPGSWPPNPEDEAALHEAMKELHRNPRTLGWGVRYVVARHGPGGGSVLIGRVGLRGRPTDGEAWIDCSLLPAFSGQGFGREAAGRVVDWALEHPEVERVVAEPAVTQDAWIGALTQLGFERDGDELAHAERGRARFVRHRSAWMRDSLALRRGATLVIPAAASPIAGIPRLAREIFDQLLGEALRDSDDLLREVRLYVELLASAAAEDPSVDLELGRDIARTCEGLLMAVTETTPDHVRRLIQAAARYFVTDEDGDSDLEIGGLDDDAAVANAVAEHLGRSDLVTDLE